MVNMQVKSKLKTKSFERYTNEKGKNTKVGKLLAKIPTSEYEYGFHYVVKHRCSKGQITT